MAAPAMAGGGLRFVAPDSHEAWCERGETMVSAFCEGSWEGAYPLNTYSNGAKCGYSGGKAKARVLCMPGGSAGSGTGQQQGAKESSTPALRVVASTGNTASCESGETVFSAYCTGGWQDYPLLSYPGGRVKCGYSGGSSQATVVCMSGEGTTTQTQGAAAEAANALGLRVVSSDTNSAWCERGESVVSAYCTGGWSEYPLQTYPTGAKCGYSSGNAKATVICSASRAAADTGDTLASGLRLISGGSSGACEKDETLVSAYCTGGWGKYPLQTYPGGLAKCGYSGGQSQLTLVCMKR